jgi:cation transport protein ChaC
MLRYAYAPRQVPVRLQDRKVSCKTFVVDHAHPYYAGRLAPETIVRTIRSATGERGTNRDYLVNTVRHLEELGIAEGPLHRLLRQVERTAGNAPSTKCP